MGGQKTLTGRKKRILVQLLTRVERGRVMEKSHKYPPTRYYDENTSLRFMLRNFDRILCPLIFGMGGFFKESRVKFVLFCPTSIFGILLRK